MKTPELSQSLTVDTLLPRFIVEENEAFVQFVKSYFDWMEKEGNVNNILHAFGQTYEDKFVEDCYQLYLDEYANLYPYKHAVRKDIFIKHIRTVLASKGSVDSIRTFFRMIYDEDVQVTFPVDRRLTASALTTYKIKTDLFLSDGRIPVILASFDQLIGKYVEGQYNVAAKVDSYETHEYADRLIIEFTLIELMGGFFIEGETISYVTPEGSVISFVVGGIITEFVINDGGTGYTLGDIITVSNGFEIEPVVAIISKVSVTGTIEDISILNTGYGYSSNVIASIASQNGMGADILFLGGGSTTWDTTRDIGKIIYTDANMVAQGDDQVPDYFEPGYIANGYFFASGGSWLPSEFASSLLLSSDSKTDGKWYFEISFHIEEGTADILEILSTLNIYAGIAQDAYPQDYSGVLGQDSTSWASNIIFNPSLQSPVPSRAYHRGWTINNTTFNYLQNTDPSTLYGEHTIRCAVDLDNGILMMGTDHTSIGVASTMPPSQLVTLASGQIFGDVKIAFAAHITPQCHVRIKTRMSEMTYSIPDGYKAWDSQTSSTFIQHSDASLIPTYDRAYRYRIKSPISSRIWGKLYRAAIHPAGTYFSVDMVDTIYATTAESGINVTVKDDFEPIIKLNPFAQYDLENRQYVVLNTPTRLYGPVNETAFPPETRTILDLPVNIFDQDLMVSPTESSYLRIIRP